MDKAERDRIRKELDAERFRVVIVRSDGSRSVFARNLPGAEALTTVIKLNVENGVSATYEIDEPRPHVKDLGIDPGATPDSN